MDAQQNAQIVDQQQQQDAQQQQAAQPVYQQPAPPPPQAAALAQSTGLTPDDFAQLKQPGQLHESVVLTDTEFEAAKQRFLGMCHQSGWLDSHFTMRQKLHHRFGYAADAAGGPR